METARIESRPGRRSARGARRAFLRHLGEMVLAMLLGMAVLGGVASGVFALAGGSLDDADAAVRAFVMGFNMTVPMVGWMLYRGHGGGRSAEMAGAMVVPTLLAVALYWAGALAGDAVSAVQHAVMIPAMVAVMLWRYDHYSR
jgi:hypothetical protein